MTPEGTNVSCSSFLVFLCLFRALSYCQYNHIGHSFLHYLSAGKESRSNTAKAGCWEKKNKMKGRGRRKQRNRKEGRKERNNVSSG